nr:bacteriochlorophyll 4-vinyl reductase [Pseudoponticoccus marisrubri]
MGPNAVLQLLPQIERVAGAGQVDALLAQAGIGQVPDGSAMIPEAEARRLHAMVRMTLPGAEDVLRAAGAATGAYILAHRIPKPAQAVLRALPAPLAARALSRAITRHAWTFAGSGRFAALTPWRFEIADNPVIRGAVSPVPLCAWHAAVFQHLYAALVHPDCRCRECRCGAQPGQLACVFEISMA